MAKLQKALGYGEAQEIEPKLLFTAQRAFNRRTLRFEGISRPSSEVRPLFPAEILAREVTC